MSEKSKYPKDMFFHLFEPDSKYAVARWIHGPRFSQLRRLLHVYQGFTEVLLYAYVKIHCGEEAEEFIDHIENCGVEVKVTDPILFKNAHQLYGASAAFLYALGSISEDNPDGVQDAIRRLRQCGLTVKFCEEPGTDEERWDTGNELLMLMSQTSEYGY